jgi:single-strand DNA-binding protein
MYQLLTILGRAGQDPKITETKSGLSIAKLSIAVNKTFYDKQTSEKVTKTEWFNVVFFGKHAENIGEYVRKGEMLLVTGEIETRQYETQDGEVKKISEVKGLTWTMVGGRGEQEREEQRSPKPTPKRSDSADIVYEDDIPF